jgi:N-sulfoglucosamine sulfohydrolase
MERRSFLSGLAASSGALAQTRRPPNIVYIHSHDTGRYIQPYGHAVPTPNLQKLATQGILFRHACDAAPTCSPSRASLLTGMCPHSNGMLGLAHRGFKLNDFKQHILHTLKPAGYTSALFGVQHIAKSGQEIGYEHVEAFRANHAVDVGPAAAKWVRSAPPQPFFLDVGFQETHREFAAPGPAEDARFSMPPAPVPDMEQSRRDMAGFKASARLLDTAVGQVMDAIDAAGLAENTLFVYTTDHGVAFPAMKCNLTDHGIGVALIMRGPGGFSGGKVSDALISHLDLYPTFCDVAGVPHPAWLQGFSMLPLIRGEKQEIREELFAEVNYHASYEPKRAVRTARWKYIRHFGDRRKPVLPNCDDGLSKDIWLKYGWKDRLVEEEQLYDLIFDPNETRNVASDPGSRAALTDMRARLDRWMQATHDPLLTNAVVPAPPGAVVNDVDGISPRDRPRPA